MKLSGLGIRLKLMLKKIAIDVKNTHIKDLRNRFLSSLKKIPDIIHLKNLVFFSGILSVLVLALFVQRFNILGKYYIIKKPDYGSTYNQGVVGLIDKINPLFVRNEAENVATKMIFSGLTRVIDGNTIVPDLAKSWTVSEDGKVYDFILKNNIYWHDGESFTANDVIYTIGLIQNSETKTSLFSTWNGVTVKKINEYEVKFTLPAQYPDFLTVASQTILPKHLLSSVDPKNIKIAEFNQKPVGTGPYKFIRFDQFGSQAEVVLESNDNFAISRPFIQNINLIIYDDDRSLYDGLARRQIDGVLEINPENYSEIKNFSNTNIKSINFPEAQVMYLNTKNTILSDKSIREAITASMDRDSLIGKVFGSRAQVQSTPIGPGQPGYDSKASSVKFDIMSANKIFDSLGWIKGKDGFRSKDGKKLELRLIYPDNYENREVASVLKMQFKNVGISINPVGVDPGELSFSFIKSRNFDLLLLPQNVGVGQDWFSFWDSSQINFPGLNLSGFSDKRLDKFVEQLHKSGDAVYRAERFKQAQAVILEQNPVVYLYRREHLSAIADKVKGYEQSKYGTSLDILNNIYLWYINTKDTY